MTEPARDWPDFTNPVLLTGVDGDGNPIAVLLDATGQMYTLLRGIDGSGNPQSVKVDSDGQLYTVLQGASGVAVAVDSDGYITAVLKGQDSGTLTTIAVDSNGRIEAFILDGENQWGDTLKTGNSELAARLGSPVAWDWRGNVLWIDDFAKGGGLYSTTLSGTGAAVALDPTYGGYGGYALKMTGGSDASRFARIQFSLGTNLSTRIGVAVRFSITPNTGYVELMLEKMIGVGSPWAYARVDVANSQLQCTNSSPAWENVGAVKIAALPATYNWLKLVIDVDSGKFERLLFNDVEVDVSAISYTTISSASVGLILVQLTNYSRSGNNDILYLDEIVVTANEPAN